MADTGMSEAIIVRLERETDTQTGRQIDIQIDRPKETVKRQRETRRQ